MKKLLLLTVIIMGFFNGVHGQGRMNIIDSKFKIASHDLPTAPSVFNLDKSARDFRFNKFSSDLSMLRPSAQSSSLFRLILSLEYKTFANPTALQLMRKSEFGDKQAYGAFVSYYIPRSNISIGLMPGLEKWQWACNVSFIRSF